MLIFLLPDSKVFFYLGTTKIPPFARFWRSSFLGVKIQHLSVRRSLHSSVINWLKSPSLPSPFSPSFPHSHLLVRTAPVEKYQTSRKYTYARIGVSTCLPRIVLHSVTDHSVLLEQHQSARRENVYANCVTHV